jgi:enoyl-CoA hydratase
MSVQSPTGAHVDYSEYDYLDVTVEDGIALIRLDRPEILNACDIDDHAELARILRDIARDDDVRVAVVTGNGRAFSVGGSYDLLEAAMDDVGDARARVFADGREMILSHVELDKPVICALNGYAMGAGAAFALHCDFVIADRSAKLADGHVRAAIAAGDGGTLIWPLTAGLIRAKRYLLTGDWISAEDAVACGLYTEVVDDGQCLARAMEYAERLAAGPQQAIRLTKRALNQWLRQGS